MADGENNNNNPHPPVPGPTQISVIASSADGLLIPASEGEQVHSSLTDESTIHIPIEADEDEAKRPLVPDKHGGDDDLEQQLQQQQQPVVVPLAPPAPPVVVAVELNKISILELKGPELDHKDDDAPRLVDFDAVEENKEANFTCLIDCETYSADLPHFTCPNNASHSMCVTCFADCVNQCCDSWAMAKSIPIRCTVPDCGHVVPEHVVRDLLNSPHVASRNLWDKYTQAQLKAALANAKPNSEEINVTCAFCGRYSEFYIKPSPDYWKTVTTERRKINSTKEQVLFETTKKLREEMDKKMQEYEKRAAEATSPLSMDPKEYEEKLKAEALAKRNELATQFMLEMEEKFYRDYQSETSQFFVCRNLFCDGAYCLKCEQFVKKAELNSHSCNEDPLEALYKKVVAALAQAQGRNCPKCGQFGKKDGECTHITCFKCDEKYCYVCGKSEKTLAGGFETHNQWNYDSDSSHCPLYLQYRYGDYIPIPEWRRADGSGDVALERFHKDLQIEAMIKLKSELKNDRLWNQMQKKKFPDQPLIVPKFVPPALPAIPFKIRARAKAEKIMEISAFVSVGLYFLFFFAMYCWLIHAGRMAIKNGEHCDQSKLPVFAIVHGALGWFILFLGSIQVCTKVICDFDEDWFLFGCGLIPAGCAFVTMFGIFVWGAYMFYKINSVSCSYQLWLALAVYFNGVWITTGIAVLFAAGFFACYKYFEL
eukprot:TRINITY_DN3751_c0_g1_i1.p1 TRINITY_DN3751_c0_g1~~TRINITY_DN3751_c0_g1_i1.p1  ORF type:complete len:711 (+),score=171.14 TRINITY_DN3751_c0_g1_i1:153-2285(+)